MESPRVQITHQSQGRLMGSDVKYMDVHMKCGLILSDSVRIYTLNPRTINRKTVFKDFYLD